MCFLRLMWPCLCAFMKRAHLQLSDRAARTGSIRYSVPPGLKNIWYRDVFIFLVPTWYRSTGSSDNTTWQQQNDFSQLNQSIPPGFAYACQPRVSGRGGGLAMLYNKKWKVSTIAVPSTFESMVLQVNGPVPTIITTVYRRPKFYTNFLTELSAFLTLLCSVSPNVIMVGDFNIHVDKATATDTKEFLSCLDSFGLKQFIDFSTHSKVTHLILFVVLE